MQVTLYIPLLLATPLKKLCPHLPMWLVSLSGKQQATKRTAQPEVSRNINNELLITMFKIKLYS